MSSPSFLVRLRTRTRRQDSDAVLQLPADHWHSGDPRMLDGSLALQDGDVPALRAGDVPAPRAGDVPAPRRPELTVVPPPADRSSVVDLRRPAPEPLDGQPWTETSTWLG